VFEWGEAAVDEVSESEIKSFIDSVRRGLLLLRAVAKKGLW